MLAVSRRTVAILRAVGLDSARVSLSDLEWRALWAGAASRRRRRFV